MKEFKDGDPKVMEKMYKLIFRTYCYNPEDVNLLNLYMSREAILNGSKVYEEFRNNIFEKHFDLHEQLKSLKVQTLILHGDTDPIFPSSAQSIHESINGSKYILMTNCGHFPYIEDPKIYFENISNFLI